MVNIIVTPFLVIAAFLQTAAMAARILGVFPHHGYSHHMMFLPYLSELANRGHDVYVISNFQSSHPNITDINVNGSMPMYNNNVTFPNPESWTFGIFGMLMDMYELYGLAKTTEGLFHAPAVRQLIDDRSATFDLIVAEHFNSELPIGFAAKYRTPFVLLSSCPLLPWTKLVVGQPLQTAYKPATLSGLSENMNLAQRLANTFNVYASVAIFQKFNRPWSQRMIKKHLGLDVSLDQFASNASLVLVNTHWTIHGASPNVPVVLEIGGIHIKPAKRLPVVSIIFI